MHNKLLCQIHVTIDVTENIIPSITYVLGTYPKGKYFEDWLKKVGYSAESYC